MQIANVGIAFLLSATQVNNKISFWIAYCVTTHIVASLGLEGGEFMERNGNILSKIGHRISVLFITSVTGFSKTAVEEAIKRSNEIESAKREKAEKNARDLFQDESENQSGSSQ